MLPNPTHVEPVSTSLAAAAARRRRQWRQQWRRGDSAAAVAAAAWTLDMAAWWRCGGRGSLAAAAAASSCVGGVWVIGDVGPRFTAIHRPFILALEIKLFARIVAGRLSGCRESSGCGGRPPIGGGSGCGRSGGRGWGRNFTDAGCCVTAVGGGTLYQLEPICLRMGQSLV